MKKISYFLLVVVIAFLSFSNVFGAVGILDTSASEEVYKFSNSDEINLPFLRGSSDRVIMDKDVAKSGITFASKNIDLINKFKGVQTLVSGDTVKITGELEYGVIIAPSVIIEGNITKSLLVISEQITVLEKSVINEDLVFVTGYLDLKGKINGNALGTAGEVNISGSIVKDLRINSDNVNLESSKINGQIYIDTTNTDVKFANYPNAIINVQEKPKEVNNIDFSSILTNALIFSIIYILISSKTNILKNLLNKVKENKRFTIISGALTTVTIPIVFSILFVLSVLGFSVVTVPAMIVYTTFVIFTFSLSSFVVGSLMSEYIKEKYKDKFVNVWYRLIGNIVIFLVLGTIISIPVLGFFIIITLCIISTGIIITSIFKK